MSDQAARAARLATKLASIRNPAVIQLLIEHELALSRDDGREEERRRCVEILDDEGWLGDSMARIHGGADTVRQK